MRVLLGLGADRGDPPAAFRAATGSLEQAGLIGTLLSGLYRSEGIDAEGEFHNAALLGDWPGSPRELLETCLAVERKAGRTRTRRNEPRVLDIDLLLFGDLVLDEGGLTLPHPRLHRRRFALQPACDLAPQLRHPILGALLMELLAQPDIQAQNVDRIPWPEG